MVGTQLKYLLYIARWAAFAVPGAVLMDLVLEMGYNVYVSMIATQALLGAFVYHIDKRIFGKA